MLQISSGAWHTAAVTSSGDLYTWGWGSDGQLGIEDEEDKQDTYSGIFFCYLLFRFAIITYFISLLL